MSVLQSIAKSSLIYGSGDMIGKFISFIVFPIIAAVLTPADFGILDLIMTVVSLAGIFVGCGLNNAVSRYYWDKDVLEEYRADIVSSGAVLQALFGTILITILLVFWPFIKSIPLIAGSSIGFPLFVAVLAMICGSQWIQYLQDITRLHFAPYKFLFLALVLKVLGAAMGLLVVVYYGYGISGFIISQAIIIFMAIPLALWMVRGDLTLKVSRLWMTRLFQFGHPFILTALAYWIFGSMDRWMLATMSSVEEAGVYSVAFRFATVVLFVSTAFGQAWSPYAVKIQADHPEDYRRIYAQVLLLLLFVMLIVGGGIALFSGEILYLLMPPEYGAAAIPLAILCFGVVLQSTQQVTAIGISLERRTYIFANLAWMAALVNFFGNYLLIPEYGSAGAAFSTLVSYLFLTTCYLYCTQRLHPLALDWWRLLGLSCFGVVLMIFSIETVDLGLDWHLIAVKMLVACLCLVSGIFMLPWKDFRHVRS